LRQAVLHIHEYSHLQSISLTAAECVIVYNTQAWHMGLVLYAVFCNNLTPITPVSYQLGLPQRSGLAPRVM